MSQMLAGVLNEKNAASECVMAELLKCKLPAIFDVVILKALLGYVDADEALRSKAVSTLIVGSRLRLDFLSGAPSFVNQILRFLKTDLQVQLASSLLLLTKQLLSGLSVMPDSIAGRLLALAETLPRVLLNAIVVCLCICFGCQKVRGSLKREHFVQLFGDEFGAFLPAVHKFAEEVRESGNDCVFVDVICCRLSDSAVFEFLVSIAANPRFQAIVVERALPLGVEARVAAPLYKRLCCVEAVLPKIAKIGEFYEIASHFVVLGEFELLSNCLKHMQIDELGIAQSDLCTVVADAVRNATDDSNKIHLMAIIYSISKAVYCVEFVAVIDVLFGIMSSSEILGIPAFLSISAIAMNKDFCGDCVKLIKAALDYVECDSEVVRETAVEVIREKIEEISEAELEEIVVGFIGGGLQSKTVVDLFLRVCKNSELVAELMGQ
jgi:hypothetical protein